MYFIGIDLGTSATKLLLMDETGAIQNIVSRSYPLSMPRPGWSEQEPKHWVTAAMEGIRELTADIDKSAVKGISVAGQMHGLVALDEADNVLRPAILWNDGRTEAETKWLNTEIGTDFLAAHTGNIAFAGFTGPKLLWMRHNEPELFSKLHKVMLPKDYLIYVLTGTHSCDPSDASGMLLFDVEHRKWSKEMLDICGLNENQMGRVFESWEPVGTIRKDIAVELGLSDSVLVTAGAGDNAAAAIGTGTVGEGRCNVSLGTSGTIFLSDSSYACPENHALHSFCHADGGWHLMGVELSSASCLSWWAGILGTDDLVAEQTAVHAKKLGKNQVFFLPYLMGERTPHNDAAARGAFIGMSMDSTRAEMTQAVLEGVIFGLRDGLEAARNAGLNVTRSTICGGGAKSPLWREIAANVLNLELEVPETEQGPGMGAAILAAVGCGAFKNVQEAASQLFRVSAHTEPDPALVRLYNERYERYKSLYPAMKGVFPLL